MTAPARQGSLFPLSKEHLRLVTSVLTSVVIFVVLYGFIDYSTGYGQKRGTIYSGVTAQWWGMEDWSHCQLVPFAALFIIYLERAKLLALPLRGSYGGLPILFLGFFFYWFGFKADNVYFSYAAAETLLAGLIIWFGGWKWMRSLSFPWMFLIFMWPMIFLEGFISTPLRNDVSHVSTLILNIIGIPAVQNGTGLLSAADVALHLPEGQRFAIDVALPCSGMRSLFALLMVSALYGYFSLKGAGNRLILFLAAVPLAIAGNISRIVMLTIGTIIMGSKTAIGTLDQPSFFHMLAGYVVFVVALGGMFGVASLLELWDKVRGTPTQPASQTLPHPLTNTPVPNGPATAAEDLY